MPRSPEYDRRVVVDRAMAVFWARGYSQTSICHLVKATGLKPGSLYAAFGSKKGVFLEVLDEYNRGFVREIREVARQRSSKIEAIRGILARIVDDYVSGKDRRGCLAVNALLEMAEHEPDVARRIEAHNQAVREGFADLIRAAQADHELPAEKNPEATAAFLVNNIWGLKVNCKSAPDRAALQAIVDGVLAALKAPA
ncbi:MAG: TetR/AcrR family transcriptional regulator [Pseudomonadota bacterium]